MAVKLKHLIYVSLVVPQAVIGLITSYAISKIEVRKWDENADVTFNLFHISCIL